MLYGSRHPSVKLSQRRLAQHLFKRRAHPNVGAHLLSHYNHVVTCFVRELWSTEERRHLRPGHFWGAELGDADGKGSPIIRTFTKKNEYFTLSDGRKMRGDTGECLLLLRRYFNRTAEDANGLTFKQEQANKGEKLVVNSSELRAVQGHQKNDFVLRLINPPKLRTKTARGSKKVSTAEVEYGPRQKWGLDPDIDRDTRKVCEST